MSTGAEEEAIEEAALLEWINLVGKCGQLHPTVKSLGTLDAGDFLLRVLHDAAPNHFAPPESALVESLLQGLQKYFRRRQQSSGAGACSYNAAACTRRLLQQVASGSASLDRSKLVQLAILATLVNDDPRATERYVLNYQTGLTSLGQQAIQAIHLGFEHAADADTEALDGRNGGEHFLDSGQDYESRYRKLKQSHTATETERERLEEECSSLRRELEEAKRRRRDAEDAESVARMELKQADMSKDRVKEEQRALYEVRSDHQAQRYKEEIKELKSSLESCKEQCDGSTSENKKLQVQLKECKRKLEVQQQRVADLEAMAQATPKGAAAAAEAPEHARGRMDDLDDLRAEAGEATHLRAEVIALTQERDSLKAEAREATDAVAQLKAKLASSANASPQLNAGGGGYPASAAAELAAGNSSDMLERLLREKERATRAEEQLKAKREDITTLKDQRKEDAAQLASLNEQLVELRSQAGKGSGPCEGEALSELKAQVAQRERELQVQDYRRSLEVEPLVTQQALMASAFHELGVKYHKLRLKYESLQRRSERSKDA